MDGLELRSRLAAWRAQVAAGPLGSALARAGRTWAAVRRRWRALLRRVLRPLRPAADGVGTAARRTASAVRPGTPPIQYRDGMVTIDGQGIVVSRYWWPWGRHRVPWTSVRGVTELPLTGARRYRVHGFSFPRHWLHHDRNRGQRRMALEVRTSGLLWPLLTPVDPTAVGEIVRAHATGPGVGDGSGTGAGTGPGGGAAGRRADGRSR